MLKERGWTKAVFPLRQGMRRLVWRFEKDTRNRAGDDAAWLDQIEIRNARVPAMSEQMSVEVTHITGSISETGRPPLRTYLCMIFKSDRARRLSLPDADLAPRCDFLARGRVSRALHGFLSPARLSLIGTAFFHRHGFL